MRIAAVSHALPRRRLTNADVLDLIRAHSRDRLDAAALEVVTGAVEAFCAAAGTEVRHVLADDEKAVDVALRASRQALEDAGAGAEDVDLVIYAAVGRGWLEPAMAPAIQGELGLTRATSFDVLDACASWLRALHVAHGFLATGTYRCALIVGCECGLYRAWADFRFDNATALEHRLAAFTIGEAATATVVVADRSHDDWLFAFRTFPEFFELCLLPLAGIADFHPGTPDRRCVPERLFSLSRPLVAAGARRVREVWESLPELRARGADIGFGHNPSEPACALVARQLGMEDRFFPTHREYGNTVSAALPLGLSVAREAGRLERGARVLLVVGSAGLTVGFGSFTF
jgi:3-oxoacyl-[acyl-carrier-protein] synthase III